MVLEVRLLGVVPDDLVFSTVDVAEVSETLSDSAADSELGVDVPLVTEPLLVDVSVSLSLSLADTDDPLGEGVAEPVVIGTGMTVAPPDPETVIEEKLAVALSEAVVLASVRLPKTEVNGAVPITLGR